MGSLMTELMGRARDGCWKRRSMEVVLARDGIFAMLSTRRPDMKLCLNIVVSQ